MSDKDFDQEVIRTKNALLTDMSRAGWKWVNFWMEMTARAIVLARRCSQQ